MSFLTRHCYSPGTIQPNRTCLRLHLLCVWFLLLSACTPLPVARLPKPEEASTLSRAGSPMHLRGLVIGLDGRPVAGAQVSTRSASGNTGPDGWFALDGGETGQWVTVRHPAFISRTRAVQPGRPVLFRLTPQDGKTISLLFTGDVMFGRRFFDPNEDGVFSDGLLPENPTLQDHLNLIDTIRPLLEDADLTVINFESPVSADPSLNYLQARPGAFHPIKDYVYSSHPSALIALQQSGVDVVGVGNNHVYDLLDDGVRQTLRALEDANFVHGSSFFGMGMNEEDAWRPALIQSGEHNLAFIGCTSIIRSPAGGQSYVANNTEMKGGAAACSFKPLEIAVQNLSKDGYASLVVLHGGYEYEPVPSALMDKNSRAARENGAPLVINHHSHVISGLDWDGDGLIAWGMGNFIFDQTLWPTFKSMVLVIHMREGKVIRAYTEPLIIEDYIPTGVIGADAETVAREIAGYSSAGFVIEDGSVESDFNNQAKTRVTKLTLTNEIGAPRPVPHGEWLSAFQGEGKLRLGQDLLWVGDFEDNDIDAEAGENRFWTLSPPDKTTGTAYAYQGDYGAHLERGAGNLQPTMLTTIHRVLVDEGDQLTISGMGRSADQAPAELQLSWYPDTKGPSAVQTIIPLNLTQDWTLFKLDSAVPEGSVAVGVYLKLQPPQSGMVSADFDDLHLVRWAADDSPFSPLYDFYQLEGSGEVTFERSLLPGWDLFENFAGE